MRRLDEARALADKALSTDSHLDAVAAWQRIFGEEAFPAFVEDCPYCLGEKMQEAQNANLLAVTRGSSPRMVIGHTSDSNAVPASCPDVARIMRLGGRAMPLRLQVERMRQQFPCFRYSGGVPVPAWRGFVSPLDNSSQYLIQIRFDDSNKPRIRVLGPMKLYEPYKHLNPDGTLCLYDPRDKTWLPSFCLAEVIVPLTLHWLLTYEIWFKNRKVLC